MNSRVKTVEEYIRSLPDHCKPTVSELRSLLRRRLPYGFSESMQYGMISYGVPHDIYPSGYHTDPSQPLPFVSLACQKQYAALYHMALYAWPELSAWFDGEYLRQIGKKPDRGKSCIRFRKPQDIPWDLLDDLLGRITVEQWIEKYEQSRKAGT